MAVLDDKFSRSVTLLKELRPGTKNVTCQFIVIDKGTTNRTKDGSTVRKCRVADKSGSICFSVWNEQAAAIEAGDILRLIKGYTSLWKGTMVLYSGKYGKLEKIGEFTMLYSEMPDMSSHDHDFLPKQQQKKSPQPGGGPSDRSGEHGPPQPTGNGRVSMATGQNPSGNSRMGITTHASGTGNWNGNNHHHNDPPHEPLPSDQAAPPQHNGNGPDKIHLPHPPAPQLPRHAHHSDSKETSSSYSRGHTRTSNSSNHAYDRPHPYQRPPPPSHPVGLDPSLAGIRPASYRAPHGLMGDLRAPLPQLR